MCVKRSELMRSEQSELHLVKHTESPECERKTKVNLSKMDFKTWVSNLNNVFILFSTGGNLPPGPLSGGLFIHMFIFVFYFKNMQHNSTFCLFQADNLFSNYIPLKIVQLDAFLKVSSFIVLTATWPSTCELWTLFTAVCVCFFFAGWCPQHLRHELAARSPRHPHTGPSIPGGGGTVPTLCFTQN